MQVLRRPLDTLRGPYQLSEVVYLDHPAVLVYDDHVLRRVDLVEQLVQLSRGPERDLLVFVTHRLEQHLRCGVLAEVEVSHDDAIQRRAEVVVGAHGFLNPIVLAQDPIVF